MGFSKLNQDTFLFIDVMDQQRSCLIHMDYLQYGSNIVTFFLALTKIIRIYVYIKEIIKNKNMQ